MGLRSPVDVGTMEGMSWWLREEAVRWRSRGLSWGEGLMMDSYWSCVPVGGCCERVLWGEGPAGAEADVVAGAITCTHRRQEDDLESSDGFNQE